MLAEIVIDTMQKKKQFSPLSGYVINLFLQLMNIGYRTRNRVGITIKPNAVNNNKQYQV